MGLLGNAWMLTFAGSASKTRMIRSMLATPLRLPLDEMFDSLKPTLFLREMTFRG